MWASVRFCALAGMAGLLFAQHSYTPEDVESGGRFYIASCSTCHGPEGDAVPNVDLGHGKFRRASTDGDLITIIRTGIPGTAMPPSNFSDFQAANIVAYLRAMADVSKGPPVMAGDAARGKTIFEGKGGCINCHRVNGTGSRVGPDLSEMGLYRRPAQLQQSILQPDAEILPQNRYARVVTKDGTTTTGRLLNQDMLFVQLFDSKEHMLTFPRSNIKEYTILDKSPMPSFQGKLTSQEVADVVSYLSSLKGVDQQ